ncbi:MAG: hypothetical protein VXW32_00365, partial [Myxococcota bacterium]|nr:hypothetical protein [Myxococcota bacterium]
MSNLSAKVGPYALVECLESGSAVQLWRAEHDGQVVAVRLVVDPNDAFSIARWQEELDALQRAGIKSSLPEVLAVFEDEKAYVLEWVGEAGLDERIERAVLQGEVASVEEAVGVGLSILDALSNLGEVHGALLPRQIRFRPDGRAVLYGMGSKLDRVQPRYMAPEMTGEGDIGLHTDQWHTAVVLFELVLGRPLYPGDWSKAFRLALDANNTEALAVLEDFSPALAKALHPALRHQGASGYVSHDEMAFALQSCLVEIETHTPVQAPEPIAEVPSDPAMPVEPTRSTERDEEDAEDVASESSEAAADTEEEQQAQSEAWDAEQEETEADSSLAALPAEDVSDSEPNEAIQEGPPQLERVEIAPRQTTPAEPLENPETQEGLVGPLGYGLSEWEIAAFSACEGADPVERGSWWVARDGAQTELPEPRLSERPSGHSEEDVEKPVALPEPVMRSLDDAVRDLDPMDEEAWPLLEASNLVGSLGAAEEESEEPEEVDLPEGSETEDSEIQAPVELTAEQIVAPKLEAPASLEEKETAAEVQFNGPVEAVLEPPVLDELPPIPAPAPARIKLPPVEELELPGREVLTELLEQEQSEVAQDERLDLPWDQPEVIIPAPPRSLPVAPPPPGTPDILSPRRPAEQSRMERVEWNNAWRPQPLSEQIARGGLLVLLGAGIAWV